MKSNIGKTDKLLRIVLALLVGVAYFTNTISGVLASVLGILAVVFLVTGLINFCPLYSIFKINTKK